MSNVQNPADAGKQTDPTTDNTNTDELRREMLTALATVRTLASRILALREEEPADSGEAWEPEVCGPETNEPEYPAHKPPFALRTDGRLMMCIDDLDGFDLGPREVFRFVVANSKEKSFILEDLDDAAHDCMGRLPSIFAKKKRQDSGEGGEQP
jgi:hypothetical protein